MPTLIVARDCCVPKNILMKFQRLDILTSVRHTVPNSVPGVPMVDTKAQQNELKYVTIQKNYLLSVTKLKLRKYTTKQMRKQFSSHRKAYINTVCNPVVLSILDSLLHLSYIRQDFNIVVYTLFKVNICSARSLQTFLFCKKYPQQYLLVET